MLSINKNFIFLVGTGTKDINVIMSAFNKWILIVENINKNLKICFKLISYLYV